MTNELKLKTLPEYQYAYNKRRLLNDFFEEQSYYEKKSYIIGGKEVEYWEAMEKDDPRNHNFFTNEEQEAWDDFQKNYVSPYLSDKFEKLFEVVATSHWKQQFDFESAMCMEEEVRRSNDLKKENEKLRLENEALKMKGQKLLEILNE